MKRLAIILPAILVLLVAVALVAPGFVDWNQYKQPAIDQIKKATGHDVAIDGNLSMAVLPSPYLYAENISVKAPEGSASEHLATIKRLDVSLSVLPLLGGKVELSSVTLVEPVIALEVLANGRQNWMTPELETMMNAPKAEGAAPPPVALQDVEIENGSFVYRQAGKPETNLSGITARLNAESLSGPFMAEGELNYAGQVVSFEGKTAALPADGGSMPINAQLSVDNGLAELVFAGVASMGNTPGAQGETTLKIASLAALMKAFGGSDPGMQIGSVLAKGLLTADAKAASFKDASFQLGDAKFAGDVEAMLSPLAVVADLKGEDTINLDDFIKGAGKANAAPQGDISEALYELLPPSLTMPSGFTAKVTMSAPALVMNGEIFSGVSLSAEKTNAGVKGGFAAQKIPGGGKADIDAALAYAQKKEQDGQDVLTQPSLNVAFDVAAQNAAQFVRAASGMKGDVLPQGVQTAALKGQADITPKAAVLKQTSMRINDSLVTISGAFAAPKGGRAALAIDMAAETLDVDKLMGVSGQKAEAGSPDALAETVKSFSLPMDVDFDIGVQNLLAQGQSVKGLRAQGQYRDNALSFKNLSAQDYLGGAFKLEGGIADLKNLAGLDLTAEAKADDIQALAKNLQIDASSLPQNIDAARLSAKVKGTAAEANVTADISALGGTASASGTMQDLLGAASFGGITLKIKHQNMNEALRMFAPSAPRYASWNKPLELAAGLDQGQSSIGLKNIQGSLAGASVAGSININTSGKPSVKGDLKFGDLVMTGGAAVASTPSGERWSTAKMDNSWMTAFNADLDIKADGFQYEGWDMKNAVLKFALQEGRLTIADMGSDLFGGRMAMTGAASTTADGKGPLAIDMKTTMNKVSIEQVVKAFTGNFVLKGQGDLDSLEATFKGSGSSMSQLVNNLSGAGTMTGRNIVLEGFDLERFARAMSEESKPGDTALGLWKTSIKGGSTAFDTLSGAYAMTGGVANISKLDLDGPKSAITTKGNVSLPAWRVDMAHTIALKNNPDVPPFTVQISGPLDNPANTFGQGLIEDYFKRKLNRKLENLLTDKLGQKLGFPAPAAGDETAPVPDAGGQPQQQQPLQAEDAIKDVLKGLLR